MENLGVVFGDVETVHDLDIVTVHVGGEFLGCIVRMDDQCWEGSGTLHASLAQSSFVGFGSGSTLEDAKACFVRLWGEVLEERRKNAECDD